ncbi:MAG: glycosyltransferase family 4 protein [Candidatus Brocadiia bacterium]
MASGLKIAIVSSGLGHASRGPETWAKKTARVLHDMGEDVTLFKGAGRPEMPYERVCRCIAGHGRAARLLSRLLPPQTWHLGLGSRQGIHETSFALRLLLHLRHSFDVVHTHDPHVVMALQRARKVRLIRAPAILGHGTYEPEEFLGKLEFVQHLAPHYLEEARRQGRAREGWTAIGNFVDTDVFRPGRAGNLRRRYGVAEDAFVVLSVAAIGTRLKRVDYLLREFGAFRERAREKVELVVAGASTDETPELVRMGREMLGSSVHFLPDRPHEEMPRIYRLGDVYALCSLWDMMPNALLEAVASGLPSLVSTHPVVGWMVGPGGQQVAMQQEGALAAALERYLDPELRRREAGAARRHAVEQFGKEVIVKQYVQMYREVVALANGAAAPGRQPRWQ